MSLDKIRRAHKAVGAGLHVIYGPPGKGKTTGALTYPDPLLIPVEEGIPRGLEVDAFPKPETYQEVLEFLGAAAQSDDHKTIVIDGLDSLENLIWSYVCSTNSWNSIEDPGYGRGYIEAATIWHSFIKECKDIAALTGKNVVLIAHSEAIRFEPPGSEPYSQYDIRLHKRASAIVRDEADLVGFLNSHVTLKKTDVGFGKEVAHAEGGGTRSFSVDGRPAFAAKNRYSMPDVFYINKGETLFSKIEEFVS